MATPGVGKDIDSFCTRCDLLLNHLVIAKVADTVKRVKCLTCGNEHAYHSPTKAAPVKRGTSAAAIAKRAALKASDYDQLMKGRDLTRAKRYKADERFAKNDVLNHAQFGFGLVTMLKDNSKIEVAFANGPKTLVHGLT